MYGEAKPHCSEPSLWPLHQAASFLPIRGSAYLHNSSLIWLVVISSSYSWDHWGTEKFTSSCWARSESNTSDSEIPYSLWSVFPELLFFLSLVSSNSDQELPWGGLSQTSGTGTLSVAGLEEQPLSGRPQPTGPFDRGQHQASHSLGDLLC